MNFWLSEIWMSPVPKHYTPQFARRHCPVLNSRLVATSLLLSCSYSRVNQNGRGYCTNGAANIIYTLNCSGGIMTYHVLGRIRSIPSIPTVIKSNTNVIGFLEKRVVWRAGWSTAIVGCFKKETRYCGQHNDSIISKRPNEGVVVQMVYLQVRLWLPPSFKKFEIST